MEITWSGHSCFTVRGKETSVVFDPCPADLGCVPRWGTPQVVLVSHPHRGHSCIEGLPENARVFTGPGEYEVGGAFITGLGCFHDDQRGAARGKNTVYVVEMEGVRLCHTGDLGHPPTAATLKEMGKVDILFVPVGDVTTLSVAEARALVRALQPRYVLPMHYRTEHARPDLEPVDTFVTAMGLQPSEPRSKISVSATSLPLNMQVAVLTCESKVG